MATASTVEDIRTAISQGNVQEALAKMKVMFSDTPRLKEVLHQSGRYQRIQEQIRTGSVSFGEATITENQLSKAMLDLLDEVALTAKEDPAIQEGLQRIALRESKNVVGGDVLAEGSTVTVGDRNTIQQAEKIYNIERVDRGTFH